ncbi:hypothetical protein BRADI_2g05611v3 [Brachypodium distachyon]|uniref:NB-ARC domain-containing protein n=1 Tax=Brachypodium distachyon TaxID=15368 RepID=A0A0Q3FXT3_BRADI|nr:hypothetical protein BRADI_2g05611v3 [Brachypodium distachyon]
MEFARDVVLPAALSELLSRLFSLALTNFSWLATGNGGAEDAHRRRLERLLASIGSTVEEAEGRHITNDHLLSQLKVLSDGMYRGRFALEATGADADADCRQRTGALPSPFNSAKRLRLIFGRRRDSKHGEDKDKLAAAAIEDLESLTRDCMREFVSLVQGYPRRRVLRPVATTLYMDRRVFGRHVETERVVNFLLRPASGAPCLSVLPIIGWVKSGKTTLVKHACQDERVRGHFSLVESFQADRVVRNGGRPGQTVWASDGAEYLAGLRTILSDERFSARRSVLIFEDAWPMDASAWSALAASPAACSLAAGSKLLLTSRDADHASIGTEEAYWYYFKALAFGGTNPAQHPRMAAMAKEMARQLGGTFLGARMVGELLSSKFDARFWRRMTEAIVRCSGRRPVHVNFLLELLSSSCGTLQLQSYGSCNSPPRLTLRDALCNDAEGAGITGGHSESEDGFTTIHLCRETLYLDHWYTITLARK